MCDVTGSVEFAVIRTTKARECPYVILLPFGLLAFYNPPLPYEINL